MSEKNNLRSRKPDNKQLPEEAWTIASKAEIVNRIEQIDSILTILQNLRRSEMAELEKIEARES